MCEVVVFAGTLEGREIAEHLARRGIPAHVCVATEYGQELLPRGDCLTVSHGRLDAGEMRALLEREGAKVAIDATHPYAVEVTENLRRACEEAGCAYERLLRASLADSVPADAVFVDSVPAAAEYLSGQEGDILVTTGSKELSAYTVIPGYAQRVYARVLPLPGVVEVCAGLGFSGRHLICMQGPFSEELDLAMLRQLGVAWLVTKESGDAGGFLEKCRAARTAGVRLVVVGRPRQETGKSLEEMEAWLDRRFGAAARGPRILLVGIGPGDPAAMTLEAQRAFREADLIIGARRMVEAAAPKGTPVFHAYKPQEIRACIDAHPECKTVAVALSGDVGFYSGAKGLIEALGEERVELICGVSSLAAFCARLKTSWEDVRPASVHGRADDLIGLIRRHPKVFSLMGSEDGVARLCGKLLDCGMDHVTVHVGERLSYPDEKVVTGTPAALRDYQSGGLCVVLVENPAAGRVPATHGLPDEAFLRDKVPMTKEEIRTISISKLRPTREAVIWDVGAGTGSVSVELALTAWEGHVYAVEKKQTALDLLERNRRKFGAENLTIVPGEAPEALEGLPAPTHAFIGGSSGKLRTIMELLLRKSPRVRMVVNAVTLETVAEAAACLRELSVTDVDIVQVSVAKARQLGGYQLMTGQDPVYIISCQGRGEDHEE